LATSVYDGVSVAVVQGSLQVTLAETCVGPLLPGTAGTVSMKVVLFRFFAFIATLKVAVTLVERDTPVAWPWEMSPDRYRRDDRLRPPNSHSPPPPRQPY
jgi:hypothetical protein